MKSKPLQLFSDFADRWKSDLKDLTQEHGRRWERDFGGEVGPSDIRYAVLLGLLSLVPAIVIAYISLHQPASVQWVVFAKLFGAPLQYVINGFLTSSLLFLGAHVSRTPKSFTIAFKLMLRIMAVHPFLVCLSYFGWGAALGTFIFGLFVMRGVRKTYNMPTQNIILFFGVIYTVFAFMQFQALFKPVVPPDPFKNLSNIRPANETTVERGKKR